MNIVLFEVEAPFRHIFAPLEQAHHVIYTDEPLTLKNAARYAEAEIISTFNESDVSTSVLTQLPRLRHLALRKTGTDEVSVAYFDAHGITLSSVPHYGRNTVAEHAFALLLALSHRLNHELTRPVTGDFRPKALPGFDLAGKTLGVIGVGNIGRHVVRIAQGFGMQVIAHDIQPDESLAEELGFPYLSKADVVAGSDVLTLHVPADESTFHLIGAADLRAMRQDAVLVNTSRGSVVNFLALQEVLQAGRLRGVCLDVFPQELLLRYPERQAGASAQDLQEMEAVCQVLKLPHVVATSHVAYNTEEAILRIMRTTCENIAAFLELPNKP